MSTQFQFTGRWKCSFWYPSNHHEGDDVAEFVFDIFQRDDKLTMESQPKPNGAHMTVNLTVDGKLATGNWQEVTAVDSEHEGLVYSGALQLIVSDDGRRMEGKWVGVGREKLADGSYETRIYAGNWLLERDSETEEPAVDEPAALANGVS